MPLTTGGAINDEDPASDRHRQPGRMPVEQLVGCCWNKRSDAVELQLIAFLDYARRGDTLAVVRLDRLGRSLAELLATVAMLKERGIALVSLEERIDTGSAAGELVFHVFGAIAHFERRLIAERTKDGILAARARGKRPGRQPLDQDKVAAALKLVAAGLSPTMAARQLGLGRSTVYREVSRAGIQRGA